MSEDWKPGDLAVCVEDKPCRNTGALNPCVRGKIYTVVGIIIAETGSLGLFLEGVTFPSKSGACWHGNFRKVRLDQHEPCEAEFTELLNRSKKQVSA